MKTEDRRPMTEDQRPKTEEAASCRISGAPPGGHSASSVLGLRSSVETCDHCGAEALVWRKCKLICEACGNIVKSCADL
ncbi:MAG: hypothetical protein ACREN6_03985 [Gemmatimonadaceae bacterium]